MTVTKLVHKNKGLIQAFKHYSKRYLSVGKKPDFKKLLPEDLYSTMRLEGEKITKSSLVKLLDFDPNILRLMAVFVIGFLGFTMIIPGLSRITESLVSRLSGLWGQKAPQTGGGFGAGFITGLSLGVVWSPCAAGQFWPPLPPLPAQVKSQLMLFWSPLHTCWGLGYLYLSLLMVGSRLSPESVLYLLTPGESNRCLVLLCY